MKETMFEIEINASQQHIWFALWDPESYRSWTSLFCEGSHYIGELKKGNSIKFLSPSGEGMHSIVEDAIPNQFIYFRHQGEIKNGSESFAQMDIDGWANAREYYILEKIEDNLTKLKVVMDIAQSHLDWFMDVFPKALEALKKSAEHLMIKVGVTISAPLELVWDSFVSPEQIKKWNFASDQWHCPAAKSELKVGGKYNYRMEAKDGSFGFDLEGTFLEITPYQFLSYDLGGERKVEVNFQKSDDNTVLIQKFEPESENSLELQRDGWQAILNNFAKLF